MSDYDLAGEIEAIGAGVRSRVWKPSDRLGFRDWCEAQILLRGQENRDYAGPYSRQMVPTMARIWETFLDEGDGRAWGELFVAKASQSACTAHALMAMTRQASYAPGNVLYAAESANTAAVAAERFRGFLEGCEELGDVVSTLSENDLSGSTVSLPGMEAWFVGAGSAGQLAARPGIVLVVVDEADKHKAIKNDVRSIEALRSRGKTVVAGKFAVFCTPRDETSQLWPYVLEGSRHRDFLPCPFCGFRQVLEIDQIRYEHLRDKRGNLDAERVIRRAEYECKSCGRGISERYKQGMLMEGELRPTNYKTVENSDGASERVPAWTPGTMSAHHDDLHALWEGSRWGNVVWDKIKAGKDPMRLRDFDNNRMGRAHMRGSSRRVTLEDFGKMRGGYQKLENPLEEPASIFCLADTQDDAWKAIMMVFNRKGDGYVIDWQVFIAWKDLVAFAKAGVAMPDGTRSPARVVLVDEGGHRTMAVRSLCAPLKPVFNPTRGRGGLQVQQSLQWRDYGVTKTKEMEKETGVDEQRIDVLVYDDDGFRWMLYNELILNKERNEKKDAGARKLWFPEGDHEDLLLELTREYRVKKGGRWVWVGEPGNDFGDCVKMGLIAWAQFGPLITY